MQSKAATIAEYIEGLEPGRREVIEVLDKLVREGLPGAVGAMNYGMPVYELGGKGLGFNAQKHYFSFYADPEIVSRYREELGGLDVGKCCIRFRSAKMLPLATLRKIVAAYAGGGAG